MDERRALADAVVKEVVDGNFSDERLNRRLAITLLGILKCPEAGLPKVLSPAELEGAYRFFSNVAVTPEQILAPHMAAARSRCEREERVRVVHDTTEFSYRRDGKRAGFDEDRAYQSFCAHVSLALSSSRRPLGIVGLLTWPKGFKRTGPAHDCWLKQMRESAAFLKGTKPIHVADAAADDYSLFSALQREGHRYVVRSAFDRWTLGADDVRQKLHAAMATVDHVLEREAKVGQRRREVDAAKRKQHPPRAPRTTKLHVSATSIDFVRPVEYGKKRPLGDLPPTLTMNVVRVWEPEPPEGSVPIEWLLLTNEPIDKSEQVLAIVDDYRARWTIEEFFKALKTGCAFERRQLQDYESLVNALSLFLPIACKMLALRTQARLEPDSPAATVASQDELDVLRSKLARRPLPDHPTARDVLLAIAALGGHIKYAPDPGWQTIAYGYETLEKYVEAWRAARLQPASDQR